jgi:hypothetical protein
VGLKTSGFQLPIGAIGAYVKGMEGKILEFCLPGGGLRGITMVGALCALREKGVVPQIVTGISAGSYAAYMAYSDLGRQEIIEWFKISRAHFRKRPIRRFIPPYDTRGETARAVSRPYLVENKVFRKMGLKHFYVGYTGAKTKEFLVEDILRYQNSEDAYRAIMKSSMIPFVTHPAPHLHGAIDGTFSRGKFTSNHKVDERWYITIQSPRYPIDEEDLATFKKIISLKTCVRNPLSCSDAKLELGFDMGWDQIELLRL